MKKHLLVLTATAFVAGTILSGCYRLDHKETYQDTVRDSTGQLADAEVKLSEAIAQFKMLSEKAIVANENKIAVFKAQKAFRKAENKAWYEEQLAVLETRNNALKVKLSNYKENGNNWKAFKYDFSYDLNELGKAVGDLTVENLK